MDYFVGLDVSLRSVAVCVVNADGKHIFERTVACEIEDIVACLRDVPQGQCQISKGPSRKENKTHKLQSPHSVPVSVPSTKCGSNSHHFDAM